MNAFNPARPRLAFITRRRLARASGFATTQLVVQVLGFASGMVLVWHMTPAQYGMYALAVSLMSMAAILLDLGLAGGVLAQGGRLVTAGASVQLQGLQADAHALQWRLSIGCCVLAPICVVMLVHQGAGFSQALLLTALLVGSAWLQARANIALALTRLYGDLRTQQRVDLSVNGARLLLLWLAAAVIGLTAALAFGLQVLAAAACVLGLQRCLHRRWQHAQVPASTLVATPASTPAAAAAAPDSGNRSALQAQVRRQGPGALWFVVASQVPVWLVGIFGTAEDLADVGALSRLGAGFAVVTAVSAALVMPWFALQHDLRLLRSAFLALNGFHALLSIVLVGVAAAWPEPFLSLLGSHYLHLRAELPWMLGASALAVWAAALYTAGCARGWVPPVAWSVAAGLLAIGVAAIWVDFGSVRGCFMLYGALAAAAWAVAGLHFLHQLANRTGAPIGVAAAKELRT